MRRGFTLVELMMVVAVIGILAALAIVGGKKYLAYAKTAEAKSLVGTMANGAVASYERQATVFFAHYADSEGKGGSSKSSSSNSSSSKSDESSSSKGSGSKSDESSSSKGSSSSEGSGKSDSSEGKSKEGNDSNKKGEGNDKSEGKDKGEGDDKSEGHDKSEGNDDKSSGSSGSSKPPAPKPATTGTSTTVKGPSSWSNTGSSSGSQKSTAPKNKTPLLQSGSIAGSGPTNQLCGSAQSVPASLGHGTKYQPAARQGLDFFSGDHSTGWKCLGIVVNDPIYYRYSYRQGSGYVVQQTGVTPSAKGFEVSAQADLSGNGVVNTIALTGDIDPKTNSVHLASQLYIVNEGD